MAKGDGNRFGSSTAEERDAVVTSAIPKATKLSTACWIRAFDEYCVAKRESVVNWQTIEPTDLGSTLESFYVDVRRKDGTIYKKNSMKAARGALQRHIVAQKRQINIYNDTACASQNCALVSPSSAK